LIAQRTPPERKGETTPLTANAATSIPTNGRCSFHVGSNGTTNAALSDLPMPSGQSTTSSPNDDNGLTVNIDSGMNLNSLYIFHFGSATTPTTPVAASLQSLPSVPTTIFTTPTVPPTTNNVFTFGDSGAGFNLGISRRKVNLSNRRRR
jgi:hypothetical protein